MCEGPSLRRIENRGIFFAEEIQADAKFVVVVAEDRLDQAQQLVDSLRIIRSGDFKAQSVHTIDVENSGTPPGHGQTALLSRERLRAYPVNSVR